MVSEDRLNEFAAEDAFLSHLERVRWEPTAYLSRTSWYHQNDGDDQGRLITYFSLEFAITEALSIYSGGLGALAGAHLKSASDLGVPLWSSASSTRKVVFGSSSPWTTIRPRPIPGTTSTTCLSA